MRLRVAATVFVGALAALGLAAGPGSAETLRVGKNNPFAFIYLPLDVGLAQGIYKKHGLDIEASNFAGSAKTQQALAAKGMDVALGAGAEMAFAVKGAPQHAIGDIADPPALLALLVAADGPIKTIADLKGKTIGVPGLGSMAEWLPKQLAIRQGWKPDDVKVLALGVEPTLTAALKTKQIDAMIGDIGTALRLHEAGTTRTLVKFGDVVHDYIVGAIFAHNDVIRDRPDDLRRFLAAWYESVAWMRAHKDETVRIGRPIMNLSPAFAATTYDELMPIMSADGRFSKAALDGLAKSFVQINVLPSEPDMAKLYTEQFLPTK
jgi:ABC-type nitrate/sulfonate/bicarbonate transport system substrate-binding protein